MNWILIIMIHAGVMSHNDDIEITNARFFNQDACQAAGQAIDEKLKASYQKVDFICIHDAETAK